MSAILDYLTTLKVTPFSGLEFWSATVGICVALALALRLTRSSAVRNGVLCLGSLWILSATLGKEQRAEIALVLVLTATVFCAGFLLCQKTKRAPTVLLTASVLAVLSVLGYSKYEMIRGHVLALFSGTAGGSGASRALPILGVSYFTFKYIHYLVDCRTGKLSVRLSDFPSFLSYILFFPSFFSGPINRFQAYREDQRSAENVRWEDVWIGLRRVIDGLFKKIVIASSLAPYAISSIDLGQPGLTRTAVLVGIYLYGIYVYFDFSGYTDIAIGVARVMGVRLPENFNYPFFRRNIQEFWANWHMSLTSWLTEYIYWPSVRKLRKIDRFRVNPVETSVISIFVTFVLCGVWHGDGLHYVLWGAYHGLGLAILNIYKKVVSGYGTPAVRKWIARSRTSYAISSLVTFNYVGAGFLLFACDMSQVRQVLAMWR